MLINHFVHNSFSIELFDSIYDENCSNRWVSFSDHLLAVDYLKLLEKAHPKDISFRYAIISNSDGKLCGIIYFQLVTIGGKNIHLPDNFFLCALVNSFLFFRPLKLLMCGNVFAINFPPLSYDPKLINSDDILEVIDKIANLKPIDAIMIKDVQENIFRSYLRKINYHNYSKDLTMSLSLRSDWKTMDDYASSLTKKYRRRAEKIKLNAENIERKELNLDEIIESTPLIYELFKNVSIKQTICLGLIDVNYFSEFKRSFPKEFKFVAYYFNSEMIAFSTYIDHGEQLEVHYIGIDYKMNKEFDLYFNILFDALEIAILDNKSELELGRTAREAKANLGCKPVYFNDYYQLKSKLAKFAYDWLGKKFQKSMGEIWEKRNPFKK